MNRMFFGFSVSAPWPHSYPKGRILEEEARHMTLAFLGSHPFDELAKHLENFPTPDFSIGPVGKFDRLLFLPNFKPRVVANHVKWLTDGNTIEAFHTKVLDWLEDLGYPVDRRPFLPHVTLARAPFEEKSWEEAFEALPVMITGIHLYESIGNLRYKPLWSRALAPAFDEFPHTADIAFHVHGKTLRELYIHAALALSFKFPPILKFLSWDIITDFNQIVAALNEMIALCDQEIGCPFKAVSYHGEVREKENFLHWEMIVDV